MITASGWKNTLVFILYTPFTEWNLSNTTCTDMSIHCPMMSLQVKVTLLFIVICSFSFCDTITQFPKNKEQRILICLLYLPYCTLRPYIPYLWWIVLSAEGFIVPADIKMEAKASSTIQCPTVSGFLQGTPDIFAFGQHYVWLPVCGRDVTRGPLWGQGGNCPLLQFLLLYSCLPVL